MTCMSVGTVCLFLLNSESLFFKIKITSYRNQTVFARASTYHTCATLNVDKAWRPLRFSVLVGRVPDLTNWPWRLGRKHGASQEVPGHPQFEMTQTTSLPWLG